MPAKLQETQRFLTTELFTKRRLNAPFVFLKPGSATPVDAGGQTVPEDWGDTDLNAGVRLVDGLIELQIQSRDDIWVAGLFEAFKSRVDGRFAYGARTVSSILIQIDDPTTIDRWVHFWPRGHKDKSGHWVETKFAHSLAETSRSKPVWRYARPLPGSFFAGEPIVWRPSGKLATDDPELGLEDLELRPINATNMESICRSIAFATLAYWIRIDLGGLEWTESLVQLLGGWAARLILEGQAINARDHELDKVCWAPIDSPETAAELLAFLKRLGAPKGIDDAFEHAQAALERDAKNAPGWTAIEGRFGLQAKIGLRRVFQSGLDISAIEHMSEIYVYDRTTSTYLDRDELLKDLPFEHGHDKMIERHQNEVIHIGKKAHNPFRLYASSKLRTDVQRVEFRPKYEPGLILRYSPVHGFLDDEADIRPDEFRIFNTFPGFKIKPVAVPDPAIMARAVSLVDRMLALLTKENDAQMLWLKQFVAFIAQYPEVKPQVAPILVGGQGIGKSRFGDEFMKELFGNMSGMTVANALKDNRYLITPFIGKLVVFVDEVRMESTSSINTIKQLVRADRVPGEEKFKGARDYYIPARLILATNSPDIGLSSEDAGDRGFYWIESWNRDLKHMTEREFSDWALDLKPFYEEFSAAIKVPVVKQHLMNYFMNISVTRAELEDLTTSSRNEESIIKSMMSPAREVARTIVASAHIHNALDITAWFNIGDLRTAIRRELGNRTKVEASEVMLEFQRAEVLEVARRDWRKFKYRYGTLVKKFGDAHSLEIDPQFDPRPDDWGENDVLSPYGAAPWRGNKDNERKPSWGQSKQGYRDPDGEPF